MSTRIEQLKEYARIIKDTPYALKTYLQTYDNTQLKFVPLDLFPDQIQLINDYEDYNENITRKYRQAGVTTVTAAWISKKLQIAKKEKPEKVLIVANKRDTAIEMANKIRAFLEQWPDWINVGFSQMKNSESRFKLNNGCEVKAVATSRDALRGYTPTILIFDEAAYIEAGDDFWAASMASLSTGGKVILISTPSGFDPIYWSVYDQSVRGTNNFHITELKWYNDPRYAKDVVWIKVEDIIHYMLNRELYNDEEIILKEVARSEYDKLLEQGYKPYSPWFETMVKKLKYDKRKINQEIDASFLGSGDNVIPTEIIEKIIKNDVRIPYEKYMLGLLWLWKEPVIGHRYIMGCLPPGEKVLTDDGLLDIEDVDIKHNLIDANGNYDSIINKQEYDVEDEDVYEIGVDNTYRTTKFTKEHPILISKPIIKRNWKRHNELNFKERYWAWDFNYVKASEVCVGDWIKVPNLYKKIIDFNEKWSFKEDVKTDFQIDSPLSDKDFWWFIGVWLGDGWIEKNKYSFSVLVCFNKKEKYYLEKCEKIIKRLFKRNPSLRERKSTYDLIFNSKELYHFIIENFNQYSYGKKISEWIKFLPIEYKKELIKGYFDSDGSWMKTIKKDKTNSKISFVSINQKLLEGIQDILFSLGVVSSLNKLRNPSTNYNICGKTCNTKLTYNLTLNNFDSLHLIKLLNDPNDIKLNRFNIRDFSIINKRSISSCHFDKNEDYIFFKVKKIDISKFTGKVYNFETSSHTFMCHRITTHNCDVSRGDSEDFSSINIIDFDENEQVLEYIGKMPPDDLAAVGYKWGMLYKAFIVVDITGGMGVATSRKLQELGYRDLYVDGINSQNIWAFDPKLKDKIPGINFNNKRTQIIASLEERLRHGFKVKSIRLANELNTFVFINGRPDHMKGSHDDAIMSLSIALYIADICFAQLHKTDAQNIAMMESWSLSERTYEPNKSFYSYGKAFDPFGVIDANTNRPVENPLFQNYIMKERKNQYRDYAWLFGNIDKMK